MNGFCYADGDDAITRAYIREYSDNRYWEASERRILRRIQECLAAFSLKTFADLGCGEGRLFPCYGAGLEAVFLVEPDWRRLELAAGSALGGPAQVRFAHCLIEEFIPPAPLDGALCSHVIQHMAEADALAVLRHIAGAVLRPGGHLFLTASHAPGALDQFSAAWVEEGRLRGESLSREEFDRRARRPDPGVLLNHAFSRAGLESLLRAAGFAVLEARAFHLEGGGPATLAERLLQEDRINRDGAAPQCPADIFVHARSAAAFA